MHDLILAEGLTREQLQIDEVRTGKTQLKECRLHCKDGRFLPVEINAQMLENGRFLSIVRDISKYQQALEQLLESNERFRLLAESSITGITKVFNEAEQLNSAEWVSQAEPFW